MADNVYVARDPYRLDREVRCPERLGPRLVEGLHRRRVRVPQAENGGALVALNRARLLLYMQYNRFPDLVSMTDTDYRYLLGDPEIARIVEASGMGTLEEILGMWIERRANDDLPGIVWAEIGDLRRP